MDFGSNKHSRRSFLLGSSMAVLAVATPLKLTGVAAQDTASIQTRVKVLHAATTIDKVEVHFNGEQSLDKFAYGDQSDWIEVDPGSVQVTITADRRGINYALFNAVYPVPAGNDYFLVISDELVLTGAFDESSTIIQGSRVQFVQGSVDTPAVTISVSGDVLTLATDLAYARTSDAVGVPSGTYDVEVALADTGEVLLTQSGVEIGEDQSYVMVLMGEPGDDDHPLSITALQADLAGATASATPVS